MEWLIGFIVLGVLINIFTSKSDKSKSASSSSGGPTISFSSHPNAGLISFLSPEESHREGILPHKKVLSCGCVTYSDDLGASATDCCSACSENSPF